MYLKDNELTEFLDWIHTEILIEVDNPGTTICRGLFSELTRHFAQRNKAVSKESLIEFMIYNIVEEFMDRPFNTALSNFNMINEYNRFSCSEMLLKLPINILGIMFGAKQNKRRIKIRYKIRTLSALAHACKSV
jgi:hypothetical protein